MFEVVNGIDLLLKSGGHDSTVYFLYEQWFLSPRFAASCERTAPSLPLDRKRRLAPHSPARMIQFRAKGTGSTPRSSVGTA